jgi:NAD(P)-dependent dehydrogenase (short-subunit alcohol dehydrogenase family)
MFTFVYFFFTQKIKLIAKNYVIVITGCDSGFGLMTATKLSSMGFNVIAACLTKEGALQLENKVSLCVICDVTKLDDIKKLYEETKKFTELFNKKLWAVINNAGIFLGGAVDWGIPIETYKKVMDVNYFGTVSITQELLPLLKETKNSRVINVSSIAGLTGGKYMSAYVGYF